MEDESWGNARHLVLIDPDDVIPYHAHMGAQRAELLAQAIDSLGYRTQVDPGPSPIPRHRLTPTWVLVIEVGTNVTVPLLVDTVIRRDRRVPRVPAHRARS